MRWHLRLSTCAVVLAALLAANSPLQAGLVTWDGSTDATWGTADNWTPESGDPAEPTPVDHVVFPGAVPPTGSTITLTSGEEADWLSFYNDYTLSGGGLTLGSGTVYVAGGQHATIDSVLSGTSGLTKTGFGTLYLSNAGNDYTGATTVNSGTLVVTDVGALGDDTSAVVVNGNVTGPYGGGVLVVAGGINFTRDLSLSGGGLRVDGAALLSVGSNTFGAVTTSSTTTTRLASSGGVATIGSLTIGTGQWANLTGNGHWVLTNALAASTGNLEKSGTGSLVIEGTNPISGAVRISAGSLRITSNAALGTSTSASALQLNGGVLEIRTDSPDFSTRKATIYTTAYLMVDHAIGSSEINKTVVFSTLTLSGSAGLYVNGRNGYGVTFTGATAGTNSNLTFVNNSSGDLLLDGNVWGASNTTLRSMTVGGTGNTYIDGRISAAGGGAHYLIKSGTGTLTITGTTSTYTGYTFIQVGNVTINGFGALGASPGSSTALINMSLNANHTTLNYLGAAGTGAGETTARMINLNGTTGGARINASQAGTAPTALILASDFVSTGAGVKSLTLGGTSTLDNEIQGVIVNNSTTNTTSLVKTDRGTWVLSGASGSATLGYTGNTTITGGTLKIKDATGSTNVVKDASKIVFNADTVTQYAGGTLEYVGYADAASGETLGILHPFAGVGTIKVTPSGTGTADLTFDSMWTARTAGATLDFVVSDSGVVSFTTAPPNRNGILTNSATDGLAFATVNGVDWADYDGSKVSAATYTSGLPESGSVATVNYNLTNSVTTTAAESVNTLKLAPTGAQTL